MVLSGRNCQKNTFHLPFIPLHLPIYPHHRLWLLTHLQHFSTFCSCHCNPGTTFNSSTKLSNPDKKLSPAGLTSRRFQFVSMDVIAFQSSSSFTVLFISFFILISSWWQHWGFLMPHFCHFLHSHNFEAMKFHTWKCIKFYTVFTAVFRVPIGKFYTWLDFTNIRCGFHLLLF